MIDDDLDLGVALEFGVSTQTLVSLMEFGLSRISAVALYERIALDRLSQDDCIAWLREREDNFEALELPKHRLAGSADQDPSAERRTCR